MNAAGQLITIVAISGAAAASTYFVKGPPARVVICDISTLKPDEVCLQQIPLDADVLWIDARSRTEWKKNGLPGSLLWNFDTSEDMQAFEAEVVPRILENPRVVVYCTSEDCGVSRQVADRIRALDLGAEISVLRGGWQALRDAGRVKDSNP